MRFPTLTIIPLKYGGVPRTAEYGTSRLSIGSLSLTWRRLSSKSVIRSSIGINPLVIAVTHVNRNDLPMCISWEIPAQLVGAEELLQGKSHDAKHA